MARKPTEEVQLKLRFSEALRRRVEGAARQSDRSLNAEIVHRLQRTFAEDERLVDVFGDKRVSHLVRAIAVALHSPRGSNLYWSGDPGDFDAVLAAIRAVLDLANRPRDR